jgi:hypothetical protein
MRRTVVMALLTLLLGCASAGGNPDGSNGIPCMVNSDCPLPDSGACDACMSPENHFSCIGGYCCCACNCNL